MQVLFFICLALLTLTSCVQGGKNKISVTKQETFYTSIGAEPETLHPIKSSDLYSTIIQSYVLESLLEKDFDTYKLRANLAKKWHVSKDGRTFTFYLRKNLKWSDGKPLTAQDVKFSFDAYRDPAYGGMHLISYLEKIQSVKVKDPYTVVVRTKEVYF